MTIGRILFLLGMSFVFFSVVILIMSLFSNGGNLVFPLFGLLNGFIAMGVGEIVIDLNHKKRFNKTSPNSNTS
ncbi:hypothetical protein [Halobacillus seohaensis]|uniref:Uncharacterized protein n=1 Tax=Halobacillus seohaensis TaxID=447421 RepID=A0ABW2ER81_9BACI